MFVVQVSRSPTLDLWFQVGRDGGNHERWPVVTTRYLTLCILFATASPANAAANPFDRQVSRQRTLLGDQTATTRATAAEALGYLRAYAAADDLAAALADKAPNVRREAATALSFVAGRKHVPALLAAVAEDVDWSVRQAAHVSLTNLTGMELPYDALAEAPTRVAQARAWRKWWRQAPADRPPADVLKLLGELPAPLPVNPRAINLARGCPVDVSSAYKGGGRLLTNGDTRQRIWQTKDVPFSQHCTVDLGRPRQVGCVAVYQYLASMVVTDYAVSVSLNGKTFRQILRRKGTTPLSLVVTFKPVTARYVRITSHAARQATYPTTFCEVQITAGDPPAEALRRVRRATPASPDELWARERAVRALGALGGDGAVDAILRATDPYLHRAAQPSFADKALVQAGLRGLGRLGGARARKTLISFLADAQWARYAADALGDCGGPGVVAALIEAYTVYGKDARGRNPRQVPRDDRPGLDPRDRMYETPYAIASALARLPLTSPADVAALGEIAPALVANVPTDWDGVVIYEPEAYQLVTAWLLDRAGWRQAVCRASLRALGQAPDGDESDKEKALAPLAKRIDGDVPTAGAYLAAVCRDSEYAPALIALLTDSRGWVRIYAAKTLMFMGEQTAAGPIANALAKSKPEADYGYNGRFLYHTSYAGQGVYNDPTPRWREAFVRALGRLGATRHAGLIARILADDRNALEVRYHAAHALDALGCPTSLAALKRTEAGHPYHSIRMVAREALWRRGLLPTDKPSAPTARVAITPAKPTPPAAGAATIVFIKGDNHIPNLTQIDPWRQTYSVTDPGPTHRLGRNLYILRAGKAQPLTRFTDGYVADCEVSWDAKRIIFARRGGDTDPWWHIWEINVSGGALRQITRGPFHDVQPAYLPDGRIVFSSSRIGSRDEYHGYLCTGLTVMNADGTDIHCIGFNFGRDSEPTVMPDGRILFSRLELFYSRLKTEVTVQAMLPDGTQNVTLYGPERRDFWQKVSRDSGERGWGEAPPRHRVLRLTQAQPFDDGRILCATTGGLALLGPGRVRETFVPHDKQMAVTSPFPLGNGKILCAATPKRPGAAKINVSPRKASYGSRPDLGLYLLDAATGKLTLLYNDPATAEFEARPIVARKPPTALAESDAARGRGFTGTVFCSSAMISRIPEVRQRGRFVRVVEGQPPVTRHHTHTSKAGPAWKNHTGTHARVLGTAPLAADGSFALEVPADRLIHLQVLDSDRRVVGNQLIWMYVRPGETRSCIGCHEPPDGTTLPTARPRAMAVTPVPCLPADGQFSYRAKFWNKGTLSDEGEERTRTVRAVNLIGRQ